MMRMTFTCMEIDFNISAEIKMALFTASGPWNVRKTTLPDIKLVG